MILYNFLWQIRSKSAVRGAQRAALPDVHRHPRPLPARPTSGGRTSTRRASPGSRPCRSGTRPPGPRPPRRSRCSRSGTPRRTPSWREAISLQGYEEGRHAEVLLLLTRHYGIDVAPFPPPEVPKDPTLAFLRTGYGECLDSFFAFGLFRLGERRRDLPEGVHRRSSSRSCRRRRGTSSSSSTGRRTCAPGARSCCARLRRVARLEHRRAGVRSPEGRARDGRAATARRTSRNPIAPGQDKTQAGFTLKAHSIFGDFSLRSFLETCLAENDRRLAPYDPRLLRPTLVPSVIRQVVKVLPRRAPPGRRARRRKPPRESASDGPLAGRLMPGSLRRVLRRPTARLRPIFLKNQCRLKGAGRAPDTLGLSSSWQGSPWPVVLVWRTGGRTSRPTSPRSAGGSSAWSPCISLAEIAFALGWRSVMEPRPPLSSLPELLRIYLVGQRFELLYPGSVAGEPVRVNMLRDRMETHERDRLDVRSSSTRTCSPSPSSSAVGLGDRGRVLRSPERRALGRGGEPGMLCGLLVLVTWGLQKGCFAPIVCVAVPVQAPGEAAGPPPGRRVGPRREIRRFYVRQPPHFFAAAGWCFLGWCGGLLETYIVLRLLGTGRGLGDRVGGRVARDAAQQHVPLRSGARRHGRKHSHRSLRAARLPASTGVA